MIEEEMTEDVDALMSDIENLQTDAEKFRTNLQQAKQQWDECKAEERQVVEQLAAVNAKMEEANQSIYPLRVSVSCGSVSLLSFVCNLLLLLIVIITQACTLNQMELVNKLSQYLASWVMSFLLIAS